MTLPVLLLAVVPTLSAAAGPWIDHSPATTVRGDVSSEGRIVVKFRKEAKVRLRQGAPVSPAGRDLAPLRAILDLHGSPRLERLFAMDERAIDSFLEAAERRSGKVLADLNGYLEIVSTRDVAPALIAALADLDVVDTVYAAPVPVPPPADIPPTTPSWESNQGYLNAAPGGIDAREAWTRAGGRGEGIRVVDVEYDWNDQHEDLEAALGGEFCYVPQGLYIDHGTAVLGELGGGNNGYGVTGIVHAASFGMVTQYPVGMSNSVARAIQCAASQLQAGDVILLEAQTGGPRGAYVPVEWNQAEFDAIEAATAAGIVVVEAAGNGSENLDDPVFGGRFDRAVRDSGAIIVGAGATPSSGDPDRSRLSFSTYGSRVDVQGWGELVYTSGYGGLFTGGGDPNQYYTATFNGTSSASPIVTGAAAALQGVQKARGAAPLSPIEVRSILAETGSPQQAGPFPGNIGPRPDLRAALARLSDLVLLGVAVDDAPPGGNGDAVLDPGETATLRATVKNDGAQGATAIVGRLAAEDESALKVTDGEALWPDLGPGAQAESLAPHFRATVQPDAACGDRIGLRVALTSVPYDDVGALSLELGRRTGTWVATGLPATIPKNSAAGVVATIVVPDAFTTADVQASVDVAHGDVGELLVTLTSPSGDMVPLHDHTRAGTADIVTTYDRLRAPDGPGTMSAFDFEPAQGTWTLRVVDDVGGSTGAGTLRGFTLELTATEPFRCNPRSCAEPVPPAIGNVLRVDPSGASDLSFSWASAGAAGYRVWRSASPSMSGATLAAESSGSTAVEAGGRLDPAPLVFYQLRAVNACGWEGP